MHRKRVPCELHESYFRSMTITHTIPKMAEVTHPDRQILEEIAGAWRRVHISAWEFEGNIRPTNWTEVSEKIPLFTKAGPVISLCALSRPSSTYIEEFTPHRRMILIPLLTTPTSHKRPSRKWIYIVIYIPCCRLFDQRAERNNFSCHLDKESCLCDRLVWFLCTMAYQPFFRLFNAKAILLEEQ